MNVLKRTSVRALLVTVAVLAAALAALPLAIGWYAERWLLDNGASLAEIENVDLDPFAGTFAVRGLVISGGDDQRVELAELETDVAVLELFSRRVLVESLSVRGARFDVATADGLQVGPLRLPAGADEAPSDPGDAGAPWELGVARVDLNDVEINVTSASVSDSVTVRSLTVADLYSWLPDQPTAIDLSVTSQDAAVTVAGSLTPFAPTVAFRGELELVDFRLDRLTPLLVDAAVGPPAGALSSRLSVAVERPAAAGLAVDVEGSVEVRDVGVGDAGRRVAADAITWHGSAAYRPDSDGEPVVSSAGDLAVAALMVGAADGSFEALRLERLTAGPYSFSRQRLEVAEVELESLRLSVTRAADGTLRLLEQRAVAAESADGFAAPPDGAEESATAPDGAEESAGVAPADGFQFEVGTLRVLGDSRIAFRDELVQPVFTVELTLDELEVADIDSAGAEPVRLTLALRESDAASLRASGTLQPFAERLSADVAVAVAGLDLSPLSSYLPGYNVERGRLALDSAVRVDAGVLDVANTVTIERLELGGDVASGSGWLSEGMAMPLDVVLDLLRDGDDRIRLELPITGDVTNPQFDSADIVRTALKGALQKAALSYAKNALQPLGTILLAANLVGQAARPRFEPVGFEPASAALQARAEEYLEKLGALLVERPGLELTLCGVAVPADLAALRAAAAPAPAADGTPGAAPADADAPEAAPAPSDAVPEEALLALARERADTVLAALRDDQGVAARRLFECRPSFAAADDGPPRVEITL